LFQCESIGLQTYWVLVVMDRYTRRIIGFGIQRGVVDGLRSAGCSSKRSAVPDCRNTSAPITIRCIGFTNGRPIFEFWTSQNIKTVPYIPWSHPFVERLIGTIRRECLDRLSFWTAADLEIKLIDFRDYYNGYRSHDALKGATPIATSESRGASLKSYRWRQHCRGLYQTPMAA
jgi:putative transposase